MFCSRCGHDLVEGARFCPSCGLDLTAAGPVGSKTARSIADKSEADLVREALAQEYELLEELGRGGMAIVYRARDRQLEREVAVKVLPFSLAFDAEFVERFQREARTAARLEHPNIIPIYRVGRAGRVIYFVMKLLRGQSLSRILTARGALAPVEIRHLLTQTGSALGFAHRHGIVHRDIKPDNIMFDEHGHPVLTDFGIAKAASGTRLTGTGMSIGTPHYMSPEQARAQPLDGRGDLYSLGVVAYQCLTGHVPFDGEDAFSIGYKHIMEPLPEPPLETGEARKLFAVIRRMLAKKPEERFQSAEDLVRQLEGGRPSVTLLEMEPGAQSTIALTAAQRAQIASMQRTPPDAAKTAPREVPPPAASPPTAPPRRPPAAPPAAAVREPDPATPTTPMPRRPAVRPPRRPQRKRSGGMLVAAAVLLALGAGGAGGYLVYTKVLHPLPSAAAPTPRRDADLTVVSGPPVDATLLALRDSLARAEAERFRGLPDSGWLVVRGVPAGARLFVGERAHRDTVLWLGVGTQKIRISATGYQDFDGSVAVPKADTVAYDVIMQRADAGAAPPRAARRDPTPAAPAAPAGQCTNPGQRATYNLNSLCWDRAPRLRGPALIPVQASAIQSTNPVFVLVHVGTDGQPLTAVPVARSGDDLSFMRVAVRYARGQTYDPATKNGRPVESWFAFRFAPQVRQ